MMLKLEGIIDAVEGRELNDHQLKLVGSAPGAGDWKSTHYRARRFKSVIFEAIWLGSKLRSFEGHLSPPGES